MVKVSVSVSLLKELLEKIDSKRNLVPRSTYIEFILKKYLEEENGTD